MPTFERGQWPLQNELHAECEFDLNQKLSSVFADSKKDIELLILKSRIDKFESNQLKNSLAAPVSLLNLPAEKLPGTDH